MLNKHQKKKNNRLTNIYREFIFIYSKFIRVNWFLDQISTTHGTIAVWAVAGFVVVLYIKYILYIDDDEAGC